MELLSYLISLLTQSPFHNLHVNCAIVPVLLASAVGSATPYIADWITGASRKKEKEKAIYNAQLQSIINQLSAEVGNSAMDTNYFRTTMARGEEQYDKQAQDAQAQAARAGLTQEQQLAQLDNRNDSYNRFQVDALSEADEKRNKLKNTINELRMKQAAGDVEDAANYQSSIYDAGSKTGSALSTYLQSPASSKDWKTISSWFK